jgi:hypothetical protein
MLAAFRHGKLSPERFLDKWNWDFSLDYAALEQAREKIRFSEN